MWESNKSIKKCEQSVKLIKKTSFSASFVSPLHTMSYQFLGAIPKHWCHLDALIQANWSTQQILNLSLPL